uniref:Neutral ceramidase n=1 Tax=Sinocyclocheilus anshuiensis TaxID=1608454 RepID=A0A671S8Q0_9TELE
MTWCRKIASKYNRTNTKAHFQYTLFMIISKVYKPSIDIAHRNLRPGRIFINKGQLGFIGYVSALSWFAVHPVSMNDTNRMVSSDNLGYSSYAFEQEKNIGFLPGEGPFVAGFSSSNLGDSSPNIRGPICVNSGEKCDYLNSSCPIGGKKACIAFGPGEDSKGLSHFSAKQELHGPVYGAHQWVNMTDETHTGQTCKPALGHSFAAGTTDGGGEFNFIQGDTDGDPFWDGIRDAVLGPQNETTACHQPKPILFSTGEMDSPLPWHPAIVDIQIITIGSLAIVAVPGEFTHYCLPQIVVIAGLCNIYTHYITTYEEYQIQRYEGASTIYGPHTLSAYIQRYRGLARAIAHVMLCCLTGPEPPFFDEDKLFNQVKDPAADVAPADTTFGDVLQQVNSVYKVGEIASVTFVAGNPRHSGDIVNKTFVTVERFNNDTNSWEIIHTDASWETRFHWIKGLAGQSKVEWHIPLTAQTGTYRIQHFGHYKQFTDNNTITPYVGTSDAFKHQSVT